MDNRCNTNGSMAAGIGEQLHDGRVYSHPAGDCDYHRADQNHSGPENLITPLESVNLIDNRKVEVQ